jgi:ferredoxin--NADP+ reductase
MSIEKFSIEKVLSVQRWTNTLFSFTMTRPAHFKFTAGQFARIGLKVGDDLVVRAYSWFHPHLMKHSNFFNRCS